MRVVITGASGNIGTALLRNLLAANHELVGVVRRPPSGTDVYERVQWHQLDLAEPGAGELLVPLFTGADAVVHLAWGFQPGRRLAYLTKVGVAGTHAVSRAAAEAAVPHLVHMSSSAVYAPGRYGRKVDETWAASGIRTSSYSLNKVAAESVLDDLAVIAPDMTVSRLRPGGVFQSSSASEFLRYGLPAAVPARALKILRVLPLERDFAIPIVHADDVARAIARLLRNPRSGAFNLATADPLDRALMARILRLRAVHVPPRLIRAIISAGWATHLHGVEPGWFDLATQVPLLDTTRARDELGWTPRYGAAAVFAELRRGFQTKDFMPSPPLRRRSVSDNVRNLVHAGPITRRTLP